MTAEALNIETFLQHSKNELIIDVRAPIEFNKGHLPFAINIPLFEDVERAEIGTLYKQQGKDAAVNRGLEIVSPKMVQFVNDVKTICKNKKVFVYCFRGGMRSNSFAWLLNTSGMQAKLLQGGYKAYRNWVLASFANPKKFIIIGGNTGSGKTPTLHQLEKNGFQLIDLEKIAHHKGSAFGGINEEKQLPQQIFENNLAYHLDTKIRENIILLEDESQNIGYNKIPHALWLQMKQATIVKLNIPFELRVEQLLKDYTTVDIHLLKQSVIKISQQLGTLHTNLCIQYLNEGNLIDAARLCLNYYDKAYNYSYSKKNNQNIIVIESDTVNPIINAEKIKTYLDTISI